MQIVKIKQGQCPSAAHFPEVERRDIFAVRANNTLVPLDFPLEVTADCEPVLRTSREGANIYRASLSFLLAASVHRAFSGKYALTIAHSLNYSYYYTLHSHNHAHDSCDDRQQIKITEAILQCLRAEMERIVNADYTIAKQNVSYQEACERFEKQGLTLAREKLRCIASSMVSINTLDISETESAFCQPYYSPLVPRTQVLHVFEIVPYAAGFLLKFAATEAPDKIAPFFDSPKLFGVYEYTRKVGRKIGITSISQVNSLIKEQPKKTKDFIDLCETMQQNHFSHCASLIAERAVRVALMAGPSSSGKTTSSKKLSLFLRSKGLLPKVIELDSYYVGTARTPKDENGKTDYESLYAIDIEKLERDVGALFAGKTIALPAYDFASGAAGDSGKTLRLEENDILLLEGIHALNDALLPKIAAADKFKVYLSPLPHLTIDDNERISARNTRLIRRIVRDNLFRAMSAEATIAMWDSVQKGERKWIFPFQDNADYIINTCLDYELNVLKVFAEPVLRSVTPLMREYATASALLAFLDNFLPLPSQAVPGQSIIREFIGSSDFKY
ncbi:MAG: nucleoside kinase [Treponemataceae bacterium]|nr:MAG: nucleoside kinase [Treponemataceae bacterium]